MHAPNGMSPYHMHRPSGRRLLLVGLLGLLVALGGRRAVHAQQAPLTIDDFHQYFMSTIVPQMAAAGDCASHVDGRRAAVAWALQAQSLGVDPQTELTDDFAAVDQFMISTNVVCYNEEYETCVSQHDPSQASKMQADRKELQQLGAVNPELIDPDKIGKCLTFELDFDSTISKHESLSSSTYVSHVQAKVPLRPSADGASFEGSAPLEYVSATIEGGTVGFCTEVPFKQTGSTLRVSGLQINFDPAVAPVDPVGPTVIDPGAPLEVYNLVCPNVGPHLMNPGTVLLGLSCLHASELTAPGTGWCDSPRGQLGYSYTIRNWSYVWSESAPEVYARKTYEQNRTSQDPNTAGSAFTGTVTFTEKTTIDLRHTPQR